MQKLIKFILLMLISIFCANFLYAQNIKEDFNQKISAQKKLPSKNSIKLDTIKNVKRTDIPDLLKKEYLQKIEAFKSVNKAKKTNKHLQNNTADVNCCIACPTEIYYTINGTAGVANPLVPIRVGVFSNLAISAVANCGGTSCYDNSTTIEMQGDINIYQGTYFGTFYNPGIYILTVKKYTADQQLCDIVNITLIIEYDCPCSTNDIQVQFTLKNLTTGILSPLNSTGTNTVNCKDSFLIEGFCKCVSTGNNINYTFSGSNDGFRTGATPSGGILVLPFETSGNFDLYLNTSQYWECNTTFKFPFTVLQDSCYGAISPDNTPTPACSNAGFESGIPGNEWKYYYGRFTGNQGFDCSNGTSNNLTGYPHFWQYGLNTSVTSNVEMPLTCIADCSSVPAAALQVHQRIETTGNDPIIGNTLPKVHSGNYAMRLGNAAQNNGIEKIEKIFTVTNTNALFSFWYALVMGKPSLSDHYLNTIPTFIIQIKDITNPSAPVFHNDLANLSGNLNYISSQDPILNTTYQYVNACTSPASSVQTNPIAYKPWSFLQLDLHTLIGKKISIELITRDCAHCGHFCYAYLDDFCSVADANNPTGSISFANRDTCGSGQICINYTLPDSAGIKGSVKLFLNTYQNGNLTPVTTVNSGTAWLTATSPNPYCFIVDAAQTSSLNSATNYFDYSVSADFKFGTVALPSQYLGLNGSGQDVLNNNDYRINCPASTICPGTCHIDLKFFANGSWTAVSPGTPYTLTCGNVYDMDRQLTCSSVNNSITVKTAVLYDANGVVQSWASDLSNNFLTVPSNITGTYFIKYVWGTATSNCDSAIYTININCPPPCQPDCSFSGTIWGTDLPGGKLNFNCNETVQLTCKTSYQGGVKLNCTNPASSAIISTGVVRDATGQIITGLPVLNYNFPIAGSYSITYYKTTASGDHCDSCVINFNITCPPPPQCNCSNVSMATPKFSIGSGTNQNYTAGTITVPCDSIAKFYAEPIMPGFCSGVSIVAELRNSNNVIVSTPNTGNDFMNPLVYQFPGSNNSTYTLTFKLLVNGVVCNTITIPVKTTCTPTTCGDWVYKGFFVEGEPSPSGAINIPCGTTKNTQQGKWIYASGGRNCLPAGFAIVKSVITSPTGVEVSNETLGDYNAVDSVKADECGLYTIKLIAACGNQPCDTCTYYVNVVCKTDCCYKSYWKQLPVILNKATGEKLATLDCKNKSPFIISKKNCNKDFTVSGNFQCGNSKDCTSKVVYTLSDNTGAIISGTNTITIPATLASGNYILKYEAYCGNQICDSCKFEIVKDCSIACNCKSAACSFRQYYKAIDETEQFFNCNTTLSNIECQKPYAFWAEVVNCKTNCNNTTIDIEILSNGAAVAAQTNISALNTLNYTFTANGTYIIHYILRTNGEACGECSNPITIKDCKPAACNACTIAITNTSTTNKNYNASPGATALKQSFSFSGLPASVTAVKAIVTGIDIYAEDNNGTRNNECLSCINNPAAWASIINGTGISAIVPVININGADINAPVALQQYQNPRQITWANNGNAFSVSNPVELTFLLPPPSSLSCCSRKATICIKFIFRDNNCTECVINKCFEAEIK